MALKLIVDLLVDQKKWVARRICLVTVGCVQWYRGRIGDGE